MPPRPRRGKARAPASSAPITIDYELYSHIFDLILSFAPRHGLLALRCTSKAVCTAADQRLARHVVLEVPNYHDFPCSHPLESGSPLLLYSPEGRLPFFKTFWPEPAYHFLWYTSDGLDVSSTASLMHARVGAALRGTRLVDTVNLGESTNAWVLPLFPNLKTVRCASGRASEITMSAPIVVRYVVLQGRDGSYVGPPVPIPGVRKLVVHVETTNESWRSIFRSPKYLPPSTTEVVLIFHHDEPRTRKLPRQARRPPPPGVLVELAQHMNNKTWLGIQRTYTFVDAHTVDPAAFGFPEPSLDRDELEARLKAALRRPEPNRRVPLYPEGMYDFERPREDNVRFFALDEYLASEGAEDECSPTITVRHRARAVDDGGWDVRPSEGSFIAS